MAVWYYFSRSHSAKSIRRTIMFGPVDGAGKPIKRKIKMMEARDVDSYAVSSNDIIDRKRDG